MLCAMSIIIHRLRPRALHVHVHAYDVNGHAVLEGVPSI